MAYLSANKKRPAKKAAKTSNADGYEKIAERFLSALEQGTVPWRKPWTTSGYPRSMSTGKAYRGINVWLLALTSMEKGYASPFWGTYNQIAEKSGMVKVDGRWVSPDDTPRGVRAGEKGTFITLWKTFERSETDAATGDRVTKTIPMLRLFYVFNADQADQLPAKFHPEAAASACEPIQAAQDVLDDYFGAATGPQLFHDVSGKAYYNHTIDSVHLPPLAEHESAEAYYSTLGHEAVHSTGHHSRLARREKGELQSFGSHDYGKEELVAEMGAALLMATLGIETDESFTQSAAYLASWIKTIKEDPKIIVSAAAAAQKALDLIMPQEAASATDTGEGDGSQELAA